MNALQPALRILIVDDDPEGSDALRRMVRPLRSRDSLVCACARAADALSLASRLTFDLVLCSLDLPEPGGLALAAMLERANPALRGRTILFADTARAERARAFLAHRRVLPRTASLDDVVTLLTDAPSGAIRAAS